MFNEIKDPTLQQLVHQMINLSVGSSAANTVVTEYSAAGWKKWKSLAGSRLGIVALPAIPLKVSLYLTELVKHAYDNGHSVAVIEVTAYSIKLGHPMGWMSSPTDKPLVKSVIEGAK